MARTVMDEETQEVEREKFRQRSCRGKRSYDTYREAERCRKDLRRINDVRTPMGVYLCSLCRKYHFGHMPDRITNERRNLQRKRLEQLDDDSQLPGDSDPSSVVDRKYARKRYRPAY
jgi:hypothetical protein